MGTHRLATHRTRVIMKFFALLSATLAAASAQYPVPVGYAGLGYAPGAYAAGYGSYGVAPAAYHAAAPVAVAAAPAVAVAPAAVAAAPAAPAREAVLTTIKLNPG